MSSINIEEIQEYLKERGDKDSLPNVNNGEGYFLEIRFDKKNDNSTAVDEEFKNKVITADCPYGSVTIIFDELGQLKSLDIS